ncbi:MAG: methyltransferase domain-containing protein [Alphaproteobacteria bacterium]|nr:methyltransferase domain-containing protein [Alphaproteobacteria bacterium]
MNQMETSARLKAAATYDAAADHFDDAPLAFWDRHGQRAVELLELRPGSRVLDVGCGTGASALPAAAAVGPDGRVIGIDLAENMLARARAKASARRLDNVTFQRADMSVSGLPDEGFDAVISVFSIFFVPDMERQVGELWRMLRPGGGLAVTVWGPRPFEPAASIFAEEILRVRPDHSLAAGPWERLTDPDNLRRLFADCGGAAPEIHPVSDRQPLAHAADWWTIAMGSGFRWEIDQLTSEQRETVRTRTVERLSELGTSAVESSALHAIARRPS